MRLDTPSHDKRAFQDDDYENRSPVPLWLDEGSPVSYKPSKAIDSPRKGQSPLKTMQSLGQRSLTEDALRANDGMNVNIDPEIQSSHRTPQRAQDEDAGSTVTKNAHGYAGMDDTCFSTFSAVPNVDMTRFANFEQSPIKTDRISPHKSTREEAISSRPSSRNTPLRNRWKQDTEEDASPTPRRPKDSGDGGNDTTNLLVDFTDHFAVPPYPPRRSPTKGAQSPSRSLGQPDCSRFGGRGRTPSPAKCPLPPGTPNEPRHLANLLDFDLPPAPTPRSIPSITARELESMKSQFLSQISSLSASLSGKEAEVKSLKDAITDAENRVGEAQEQLRDERGAKEALKGEKEDWEKRQGEMQRVLKDVKEEIISSDRERDALFQRAQEAEHKREEAELKLVEAESKVEGLRLSVAPTPLSQTSRDATESSSNTQREVEAAVTKVAKELHGLYKSKHETKVTALKKSYSDRWEEKVRELTIKVEALSRESEELRQGREATMTGVDPSLLAQQTSTPSTKDQEQELSSVRAELTEAVSRTEKLQAHVTTLELEIASIRSSLTEAQTENGSLRADLEASRSETADLIALSEELMSLSSQQPQDGHSNFSASITATAASSDPSSAVGGPSSSANADGHAIVPPRSTFSRSTSGSSSSGIRAPGLRAGGGESRIGRVGIPGGGSGGNSSRERSGSGLGRSGILSNIERMGRGREN